MLTIFIDLVVEFGCLKAATEYGLGFRKKLRLELLG